MKKDKLKTYALEILLLFILFFALFVPNIFTRVVLAITLTIYMFIVKFMLKKRNIISIYRKQVTIVMILLASIYVLVFYLLGLYFGFYKAPVTFSIWSVFNYIIPLALLIVSSEIIRSIFLSQNIKSSKIITLVSMILIDLIIYTNVYDITTLNGFLTIIGFIFFASVSCNLLYNYTSVRFGCIPVIVYRIITVLYAYLIPIIPDVYVFFRSFLRMLYPYIIYLILEYSYSRTNFTVAYKDKRKNIISTTIIVVIMTLIIMLVSCQFRYGILIIGSESMTGSINKGDAVVFESYREQNIKEGEIIIFKKDRIQVVHRVVKIRKINDEYRYFTKGDANQENDAGYITQDQIVGVSKFKIKYIGFPSLWINDIFS